jgi:hypothetical protein
VQKQLTMAEKIQKNGLQNEAKPRRIAPQTTENQIIFPAKAGQKKGVKKNRQRRKNTKNGL